MTNTKNIYIYTVGVLLSTYNGARWLREQLDSLVAQKGVEINLFVRDDGSTDETVRILEEYRPKFKNLIIWPETNVGWIKSFHTLGEKTLASDIRCDYYAFCDQDDIWKEDKLIIAIEHLRDMNPEIPNLYFSNLMMVNATAEKELGKPINPKAISTSRENALAAISMYGCTAVFNRCALAYFCRLSEEMKSIVLFDQWMFAVCAICGEFYYDDEPHQLYRQTGYNASGSSRKQKGVKLWVQRIKRAFNLKNDKRRLETMASELLLNFPDVIAEEDIKYVRHIRDYRRSPADFIAVLFSPRMKTQDFGKNVCIVGRTLLRHL